ncbi:phage baseplate assembly protein V [Capnocytophaga sputigena]|uniref:type VI secretion system Vgr family protein n=1 Tax=Capnocytophaga sputigena TaxID=1019 RepID=UPI00288BF2D7|nr:phage baseplate assembly protein V [Capnocytophaga sputigena]
MDSLFSKLRPIFHSVHIDGKDQTSRINSLHIQQTLNSCCDFELVETIATRKTLWQGQSQELLKQVGKNVIIRLSFPRGKNTFQFSGFITEVVIDSDTPTTTGSSENKIRIIGKGSPIVLDDSPAMNSFVDQDLKNIVEKVFKNKYFDLTCIPKFKSIIPYAMQYKESRWEFLNRLSAIYNELLYFDGSKLIFGGVIDEHSDDFTIGEDITEFKVSSKTLPFKYTLYNYSAEDDEYCYSDTEDEIRPRNFYTEDVFKDYENLYQQRGMLPIEEPTHLSGDTIRLHQSKYQQALGKMHCVEGKTRNSLVRLGSLIYVKFPSLFEKENMGEYRVISVEHHVERDDYYNHFVAVPLGMEYSLYEPKTIAYPEIAEVVANNDPKKQGRVQVRFFWQKMLAEQTPWIRVQTPDAGVLTDKSGNRGFQFIPEVGDQVMVSYEGGNPHRPYVSGSMYHGKNAKEVSNNIRSITTKSGSTIVFDDTDRAEKITIKDKKGNTITFDSKDKSLSLQSPETINISAKNVKINAQENVEITAEKDIITHSKSETVINSEVDIDLVSQKNISLQSEERMTLRSDNTLAIEAQNKATLRADTTLLQGDSLTELSGERIKLKGESLAELMARLVKIN